MGKLNLYLFGLCVLFLIIKLISITATNFDLYGDEAQYWLWSKELSFGYYSKPPLLPWFIFLITFFFGDSFFVLKAIPVFLYCITSYLVFIFTKKLFKDLSLACCCALSFFLLPSVSLSSFLLSTDILLIFFWVCALIYVLNIKERPTYYNFFCLGFFICFFIGRCIVAKCFGEYCLFGPDVARKDWGGNHHFVWSLSYGSGQNKIFGIRA